MKLSDLTSDQRNLAESLIRLGDSEDLAIRTAVEETERKAGWGIGIYELHYT